MQKTTNSTLYEAALEFHKIPRPGKTGLELTKRMVTKADLSLAYSPGVAAPCTEIQNNPEAAYKYTAKGNSVAVISNGTAVLGLGNIGALASKPVMEGKACLLKRFSNIDGVDIEVDENSIEGFVSIVRAIGNTWGGINLEDIKAPECFVIEEMLSNLLDIPVFHDDQHGTAVVILAGLINALSLVRKRKEDVKIVINGAGSAAIASAYLLESFGFSREKIVMCDSKGVIHRGRDDLNEWKKHFALPVSITVRTLTDAAIGADVLIGCSVAGAFSSAMIKNMAPDPIVFALANPEPEIRPEDAQAVRNDVIIGTGRSDYTNQINNVLGFPYIFRGALDVRATKITTRMKLNAAHAIAMVATQSPEYGKNHIVPSPFNEEMLRAVSYAVASAAISDGVAKIADFDLSTYNQRLNELRDMLKRKFNDGE
ncbi:NADP-dependent malic enzyme domain protein [Candidatus Fokinia solitaria]|uniref:NADP-dependent malic enzyme domain protein n=1 Tax=Candidatus Fokinia solitaria TaxID=1802984 RepID=A0A2U8BT19_9RICK|nr:malic enzyme-like NAD(P)-binding protein [Candidatus Fokinia solitaria]AWD33516.1 NADP-dependent malic enzyme domain protein [Candidatus Fokinia solitaria]